MFTTTTKAAPRPKKPSEDARLPRPGTVLTWTYKRKQISVQVLRGGFLYEGKTYRSLSAIAKAVTGQRWNGYGFFNLLKKRGQ